MQALCTQRWEQSSKFSSLQQHVPAQLLVPRQRLKLHQCRHYRMLLHDGELEERRGIRRQQIRQKKTVRFVQDDKKLEGRKIRRNTVIH